MGVVVPDLNLLPDLCVLSTKTTPQLPSVKRGDCQLTAAESLRVLTVIVLGQLVTEGAILLVAQAVEITDTGKAQTDLFPLLSVIVKVIRVLPFGKQVSIRGLAKILGFGSQ